MAWMAGTSRMDITPPVGYRLQGHVAREKPSCSVHDPLTATVLTISDESTRLAIVSLDLLHFEQSFYDELRGLVEIRTGLSPGQVLVACSHTHTGPFTVRPPDGATDDYLDDYMSLLQKKICGAILEAIHRERPARLSWAVGDVDIGAINRRRRTERGVLMQPNPEGPVDRTCPVLRVDDHTGSPMAVLYQYACHPTTLSPGIHEISADYPGVARREVEKRFPTCHALFLNGCCGDVRPAVLNPNNHFRAGDFEDIERMGSRLSDHVCSCMERAEALRQSSLSGLLVPHRYDLDSELLPRDVDHLGQVRDVLQGRDPEAKSDIDEWYNHWHDRFQKGEVGDLPDHLEGSIQFLRIGELQVAALPGEVMSGVALGIRERVSGPVMIAGYAQGGIGYLPTAEALLEGGYETRAYQFRKYPAPFAPGVAVDLIEACAAVMNTG